MTRGEIGYDDRIRTADGRRGRVTKLVGLQGYEVSRYEATALWAAMEDSGVEETFHMSAVVLAQTT